MTTTSPTSIVRNGSDFEGRINGVLVFTDTSKIEVERVLANLSDTDVAPAEPIAAAPAIPAFDKSIEPAFITDGRRRRLVGYDAWLDGRQVVWGANSYVDAERALDGLVYDELVRTADIEADRDALNAAAQDRGAGDAARYDGRGWSL